MKYRQVAENGATVSGLAIGGNIFGYACDQAQTMEILCAAREHGINFLDTADVYSEGRSEEMIGCALGGRREHWIIASKVGVTSDGNGQGIAAKKVIFNRLENSLRRLQTDYIDLYQLHHFDCLTPVEETLEAMDMLQAQGKIRYFGLSNFNARQVDSYIDAARKAGSMLPATNQIHCNMLKREMVDEHLAAHDPEWPRLLVYGALGRGVLSGKYRLMEVPQKDTRAARSASVRSDLQPDVIKAVEGLSRISLEAGITMSQLAIAYVMRSSKVVSAIVGVRSVAQLDEMVGAYAHDLSGEFWAGVDDYLRNLVGLEHASLGKPVLAQ